MPVAIDGVRTPASLPLPKHIPTKNVPDFTLPNKDTPKTRPVLGANPYRRTFSGRMLLRPYTGTCKICPVLYSLTRIRPNPYPVLGVNRRRRTFSGRMLLRPYMGTCKTRPVSYFRTRIRQKRTPISPFPIERHPKPTRFYTQTVVERHFGAYAFAPLHGYVQNLAGFTFPHPDAPKTHPVSPIPIRICPKPARF